MNYNDFLAACESTQAEIVGLDIATEGKIINAVANSFSNSARKGIVKAYNKEMKPTHDKIANVAINNIKRMNEQIKSIASKISKSTDISMCDGYFNDIADLYAKIADETDAAAYLQEKQLAKAEKAIRGLDMKNELTDAAFKKLTNPLCIAEIALVSTIVTKDVNLLLFSFAVTLGSTACTRLAQYCIDNSTDVEKAIETKEKAIKDIRDASHKSIASFKKAKAAALKKEREFRTKAEQARKMR